MRVLASPDGNSMLWRLMSNAGEAAYFKLGLSGLQCEIEFPSDWHERERAWVRLGFGLGKLAFSFPWRKTVPDEGQCSGPTYGFQFYEDLLWIRYGKDRGQRDDPHITIHMPWMWHHRKREILSAPETHPFIYKLRSGEVQNRQATIQIERRTWTRYWLPFKQVRRYIDIKFDDEVGERSGSWKGGVIGCSYDMLPRETALDALRRMERERKL